MTGRRDPGAFLVPFGIGLGAFGLVLTLLLPMGQASPSARHLAIAALWSAGGLLGLAAAGRGERPAALASSAGLGGLALLVAVALRGPITVEGLEILLGWGGLLVTGLALHRELDLGARRTLFAGLVTLALLVTMEGLLESGFLLRARRGELDLSALTEADRAFFLSTRARSVFGQANGLGAFVVLLLPVALGCARRARRGGIVFGLALLALLLVTRSFGAMAVIATLSLLAALIELRRETTRSRRLAALALACLLGAGLIWLAAHYVAAAFELLVLSRTHPLHTLGLRADYARSALKIALENLPFGAGWELYDAHVGAFAGDGAYARRPHNALLALLAELGLLGLLVVAWFAVFGFRRPRPGVVLEEERPGLGLALLLGGALATAAAVHQGALALAPPEWLDARGPASVALVLVAGTLVLRAFALPLARRTLGDEGTLAAAGWGLAGLALHALIDIDLWVPNLLATATILAILRRPAPRARTAAAPRRWSLAAVALIVPGLSFALLAQPAARAADLRAHIRVDRLLGRPSSPEILARSLEAQLAAARARPISRDALAEAMEMLVFDVVRTRALERAGGFEALEADRVLAREHREGEIENLRRARRLLRAAPSALREAPRFRHAMKALDVALSELETPETFPFPAEWALNLLRGKWSALSPGRGR